MRARASLPAMLCVLALAACGDNATEPTLSPSTKPDFLPSHDALRAALQDVLEQQNGGLGFEMWASFVDRDGVVRRSFVGPVSERDLDDAITQARGS